MDKLSKINQIMYIHKMKNILGDENKAQILKVITDSDPLENVPTTPLEVVSNSMQSMQYLQRQNISISRGSTGRRESQNINNNHSRNPSQIDTLLSMSQMCPTNKRSSIALKYFNDSTFDPHTKDLVKLVTKFSVLVVWSAIMSIFAAIFFISFVIGYNDNVVLQNISASYITLITCFVEMHVVYLQLNGTEKWYKFLCGFCHRTWGKCCVCKLRRRLVRKIGKQHKELTLKANESQDRDKHMSMSRESSMNGKISKLRMQQQNGQRYTE